MRNVVNSTGVVIDTVTYDGYGNATQSNVTNGGVYLWDGYRYDAETGLFRPDLSARYYNPLTGRWESVDPIGMAGDVNLYRYCVNSPTNRTDPSGLASCGPDVTNWFMKEIQLFTDAAKTLLEPISVQLRQRNSHHRAQTRLAQWPD